MTDSFDGGRGLLEVRVLGLPPADEATAQRMRSIYEARLARVSSQLGDEPRDPDRGDDVRDAVLAAERRRLATLGADHAYPSDVLREIAHELDLEESRRRQPALREPARAPPTEEAKLGGLQRSGVGGRSERQHRGRDDGHDARHDE